MSAKKPAVPPLGKGWTRDSVAISMFIAMFVTGLLLGTALGVAIVMGTSDGPAPSAGCGTIQCASVPACPSAEELAACKRVSETYRKGLDGLSGSCWWGQK